ncbi:hypothetical protein IWZ01DRAFT_561352 [Phyllosticta capitalensis]
MTRTREPATLSAALTAVERGIFAAFEVRYLYPHSVPLAGVRRQRIAAVTSRSGRPVKKTASENGRRDEAKIARFTTDKLILPTSSKDVEKTQPTVALLHPKAGKEVQRDFAIWTAGATSESSVGGGRETTNSHTPLPSSTNVAFLCCAECLEERVPLLFSSRAFIPTVPHRASSQVPQERVLQRARVTAPSLSYQTDTDTPTTSVTGLVSGVGSPAE